MYEFVHLRPFFGWVERDEAFDPRFVKWRMSDAVPELAASTGSARREGEIPVSPVLAAMGLDPRVARGAVRMSVGRYTSEADIDRAAALLIERSRSLQMFPATGS